MSVVASAVPMDLRSHGDKMLKLAAILWFSVACAGQLMFAVYIAGQYGLTAMSGNMQAWNEVMANGLIAGDSVGNAALLAHLSMAWIVTTGGLLQLIPAIRQNFPKFHRWNGRTYMTAALLAAVSGLVMVWTREAGIGDMSQSIAISIDAVLIIAFGGLAWRYARARRFDVHREWALRLFMVVSAVWFFRVGLMFWIAINGGPVGFDPKTFEGPALTVLAFAQYLLPLAILEIYLRVQKRGGDVSKLSFAGALALVTMAMGVGIVAVTMGMWLPRLV